MPTTPRRALLVIDVQNEYFTGRLPIAYPPVEQSLRNIGQAMEAAREAGIPVIHVLHDSPEGAPLFAPDSDGWRPHPILASPAADHTVHKTRASAFMGTDLADWLGARDIDTVTVVGYMTHNCDAVTIFDALHRGLSAEFLSDASGSPAYRNAAGQASGEEIHRVFCTVFHSNFAAVTTTAGWIEALRAGRALKKDNIFLSSQRADPAYRARPES
ncbi:cysteine hydrolase family protein [Castellaniella sp.]|jgi:nicotinamidase-related amidase|uniref:cysteine hydrolase family protein n=1 Tax=Castellaniella sp. TaxID=1955812 RepID=UPI002D7F5F7F|nr:cysteine hydrolase family protein [Castellaniella sp.]HET8703317.1 cysteine hydrolase family protein [Castellaniella sp.]